MKIFLILFVSVLFLGGCQQFSPYDQDQTEDSRQRTEVAPQVDGPLLARVGSWGIGLHDFQERMDVIKQMYPQVEQIDSPEAKREVLQELVNMQILAEAAKRRGLDRDRDIELEVNNFKRQLLTERLGEEVQRSVIVADSEIRNFYDTNQASFRQPEERRIGEIAVANERQARRVLIRLLEGENFSQIARDVSLLDSAAQGGDLGYLVPAPGEKFEKFWEIAYTTEVGQNSSYFEGPDGRYYILKVEGVRGGGVSPLSEVRDDIRDFLQAQKMSEKLEEIIEETKRGTQVIINQDLLD